MENRDSIDQGLTDETDEFTSAVEEYRADPQDWRMELLISRFFTPIARHWAYEISISYEDREDAEQDILCDMIEKAKPSESRRVSCMSPILGLPVAGYRQGNAQAAFYDIAKKKAMDIYKSRTRRWKRECAVRDKLFGEGLHGTEQSS